MKNFDLKKINSGLFAIFFVGILTTAVGFYTENMGFLAAGGLFLLVSIVMFLNQMRRKED